MNALRLPMVIAACLGVGSLPAALVGCSNSGTTVSTSDASSDAVAADSPSGSDSGSDAGSHDGSVPSDSGAADAGSDVPVSVTGYKIVTADGAAPSAKAGDAIPLKVVVALSDGTTNPLPMGASVTWTAPATIEAQDPADAGGSILPMPGPDPTGFFVSNSFRSERTDYPGTLFVTDPGTASGGMLTVTASIGDAGTATVQVPVGATPAGDPDAGANLFAVIHNCANCHGMTGGGSPPSDAGDDGAVVYVLQGMAYPYPAPGLNNYSPDGGSPNVAADPNWNAALLGMAAQADIDNNGVALRKPMPDWLGKAGLDGGALSAQDFADIYAFLKTQAQ